MKRLITCLAFIVFGHLTSSATIVQQTLYLNRGLFLTVDSTTFPALAFNDSPVFDALNKVITIATNDTLIVSVTNNDTVVHGFGVMGYPGINGTINPSSTLIDTLICATERIFIYYDNYSSGFRYLGAAGMICITSSASSDFYWNIKEYQTAFNDTVAQGGSVNWSTYYPDYFTINGKSFPDLQNDTTARVTGQVGDTIHIFIINSGQAMHSLHFHGFHERVLFSTSTAIQQGSVKETFPLRSMEGIVLELVPDKVGQYSVHDHNLVAVTGGNTHPNGMFIIMEIQ